MDITKLRRAAAVENIEHVVGVLDIEEAVVRAEVQNIVAPTQVELDR